MHILNILFIIDAKKRLFVAYIANLMLFIAQSLGWRYLANSACRNINTYQYHD